MHAIKLFTFGIIGFAFGLGLSKAWDSGYFQEWNKLPTPPQHVVELVPTDPFLIKVSDNSTYYYSSWKNEGWLPRIIQTDADEDSYETIVQKPCDFLSPEFFPRLNMPQNVVECFQSYTMVADGRITYSVAVDGDGNVWEWKHIISPEDLFMMLFFPLVGLLAGLLLAISSSNIDTQKGLALKNTG